MLFGGIYPFIDNQHPMEEYTKLGESYLFDYFCYCIAKLLAVAIPIAQPMEAINRMGLCGTIL